MPPQSAIDVGALQKCAADHAKELAALRRDGPSEAEEEGNDDDGGGGGDDDDDDDGHDDASALASCD